MTATVRCFAHSGVSHAFVADDGGRQDFHAVPMLKQPYLARETLTASTGAAVSSASGLGASGSRVLAVQVDPGKRVHYEITPSSQTLRTADTSSPVTEGNNMFHWGTGWTISLLEVT